MLNTKSQLKNWRRVELGTLCVIDTGKKDVNEGGEGGKYPFFTCARETLASNDYSFDTDAILVVGNGSYTAFTKKYSGKFDLYQRTYALHDFDKSANFEFLYYYLKENFESKYMGGSHGAAIPYITKPTLTDFEILLPPLPTQKQIASILSAYDDLIENNTKRIKILEEIAQAIYREWFVYFRSPGHEKVKMIDSKTEFGKIPEGWKIKPLGEIVENYDSKRRPISKMKREEMRGEIPYYGAAKIIDYVNDHIFDGKYLLMAEDGSVITKSGNPVLQFVNEKFWANNHTHILQGVDVSTEYLYLSLVEFPIQGYITGVAQPKINQDNLNRIPVLVPENKVAQIFNSLVEPIFADTWKLKESVNKLLKARDLLLPKLVTGEIEIKQ